MRFGLNCSGAIQAMRQQIEHENSSSGNLLGWFSSTWKSLLSQRADYYTFSLSGCRWACGGVSLTIDRYGQLYFGVSVGVGSPAPGLDLTYSQSVVELGSKKRSSQSLKEFISGAGHSVQAGIGPASVANDWNGWIGNSQQSALQVGREIGTADLLPQSSYMWNYTWNLGRWLDPVTYGNPGYMCTRFGLCR